MIPPQLTREPNETTEQYCWRLMTDYKANPETLKFTYNYTDKTGEKQFSKQLSLMQLWHHNPEDKLPETNYHQTRTQYFKAIQHRTILACELTFDIDDKKLGQGFIFPTIKDKARFILKQLKTRHHLNPIVYFTGNKSYHITCIIPDLLYMSKDQRRDYRMNLLSLYACDTMKASEHSLIAIENVPHYRSGLPKCVVEL